MPSVNGALVLALANTGRSSTLFSLAWNLQTFGTQWTTKKWWSNTSSVLMVELSLLWIFLQPALTRSWDLLRKELHSASKKCLNVVESVHLSFFFLDSVFDLLMIFQNLHWKGYALCSVLPLRNNYNNYCTSTFYVEDELAPPSKISWAVKFTNISQLCGAQQFLVWYAWNWPWGWQ